MQRTEEFFARQSIKTAGDRRNAQARRKKKIKLDATMEEDWKHVLSQVVNIMFDSDDPIEQLPFDIDVETSENVTDLISIGCCFPKRHPLYKWVTNMLCP